MKLCLVQGKFLAASLHFTHPQIQKLDMKGLLNFLQHDVNTNSVIMSGYVGLQEAQHLFLIRPFTALGELHRKRL